MSVVQGVLHLLCFMICTIQLRIGPLAWGWDESDRLMIWLVRSECVRVLVENPFFLSLIAFVMTRGSCSVVYSCFLMIALGRSSGSVLAPFPSKFDLTPAGFSSRCVVLSFSFFVCLFESTGRLRSPWFRSSGGGLLYPYYPMVMQSFALRNVCLLTFFLTNLTRVGCGWP